MTTWERLEHRRKVKKEAKERYNAVRKVWSQSKSGISANLKKKYGITFEDREAMLVEQNGKCGNLWCSRPLSFDRQDVHSSIAGQVDHCHRTGKVRGLLCRGCNMALGQLQDSPERIQGLAAYLLRNE